MNSSAVPLLERQRIFHSCDAEETRAFLRSKEFRFEIAPREARRLDVHINGVYLPGMFIGYIEYGSPVTVWTTPARDDYWIQLPLRGCIETTTGRARVACDRRRAAVCTPRRENTMRSGEGSARFNVSLTSATMTRQLTALLGDVPRRAIEFEPVVDLTKGYGRSLARHLRFAVGELECADSMLWDPIVMARFEELVVTGLLLSQPHNYTEVLSRLERPIAPRDVKRAVDYIHANLCENLTLADVVAQACVPGRTLLEHFRQFKGVPPMRYLRNARFDRVREALSRARPGESVSDIASRHGFSHMGRFSVEYRLRFGEVPSTTLARGRRG